MAWEETVAVIKIKGTSKPQQWLERVGREAVNVILERTKSGKDKSGNRFAPYSDEYAESDNFKLAGKSRGNVNLTLMGEMLADLSVLSARDNTIVIGFRDDEQRAKANGHITGHQGQGGYPKRDFLGISERELQDILNKVPEPTKLKEATKRAKELRPEIFDLAEMLATTEEVEIL